MEHPDLKKSIDKLEKTEAKLVSLKWNFYRGIAYGFGFFVGGTILVGLLVWFLSLFGIETIVNYLMQFKK